MKYTFDARIRFSEVDSDGYLKLENFINYFQDCSTFQSEDIGVGVEYLRERDLVWVVCSWQVEILKYPRYCDRVRVGTFAYDFKSFLGYRNFFMLDENGEMIAKANSVWVLLNTKTGRPSKTNPEQLEAYGSDEKLEMNYLSRKIDIPDDLEYKNEFKVEEHHLDTNRHMNNGQYVRMAVMLLPEDKRAQGIRVEYKNQAHLGDTIYSYSDGKIVDLRNKDNESYCVVEIC